MSESDIQKSILDYLAAEHIFALRMNSGTTLATHNGKTRAIRMQAPGTADILAFKQIKIHCRVCESFPDQRPLPLWIEVKSATGKLSKFQKSFKKQVEEHGHMYIVARSIEDVKEALR